MIRNVILKKMIKNVVFPIITLLNKIVKKDDSIVLLYISNMGIRHSLLPLRQYLLDNHFNERYKIYCGIEHLKYAEDEPRVTFISGGKTLLVFLTYIIHSGFISGYQNRYGDNLKPPTNVYHRMTA